MTRHEDFQQIASLSPQDLETIGIIKARLETAASAALETPLSPTPEQLSVATALLFSGFSELVQENANGPSVSETLLLVREFVGSPDDEDAPPFKLPTLPETTAALTHADLRILGLYGFASQALAHLAQQDPESILPTSQPVSVFLDSLRVNRTKEEVMEEPLKQPEAIVESQPIAAAISYDPLPAEVTLHFQNTNETKQTVLTVDEKIVLAHMLGSTIVSERNLRIPYFTREALAAKVGTTKDRIYTRLKKLEEAGVVRPNKKYGYYLSIPAQTAQLLLVANSGEELDTETVEPSGNLVAPPLYDHVCTAQDLIRSLEDPHLSFSSSDLSRITGVSQSTQSENLSRLVELGLLTRPKRDTYTATPTQLARLGNMLKDYSYELVELPQVSYAPEPKPVEKVHVDGLIKINLDLADTRVAVKKEGALTATHDITPENKRRLAYAVGVADLLLRQGISPWVTSAQVSQSSLGKYSQDQISDALRALVEIGLMESSTHGFHPLVQLENLHAILKLSGELTIEIPTEPVWDESALLTESEARVLSAVFNYVSNHSDTGELNLYTAGNDFYSTPGLPSKDTVGRTLAALEEKGMIAKSPGASRGKYMIREEIADRVEELHAAFDTFFHIMVVESGIERRTNTALSWGEKYEGMFEDFGQEEIELLHQLLEAELRHSVTLDADYESGEFYDGLFP